MNQEVVASQIVDSAVRLHKTLGPGLLESAYVCALCIELEERGLAFDREVPITGRYRDKPLGLGFRADLIVEKVVLIEVKSVQALEPVHIAQTLSYLRLADLKLGFLLNFNVPLMKSGIKRVANNL